MTSTTLMGMQNKSTHHTKRTCTELSRFQTLYPRTQSLKDFVMIHDEKILTITFCVHVGDCELFILIPAFRYRQEAELCSHFCFSEIVLTYNVVDTARPCFCIFGGIPVFTIRFRRFKITL